MDHGSAAWVTPDGLVAGRNTASSSLVEHDAYMPPSRNTYLKDPSNSRFEVEGSASNCGQGPTGPLSLQIRRPASAQVVQRPSPSKNLRCTCILPRKNQLPDPGQERRLLKTAKAKRPSRKHTSKEEANFQCEVKGCGKFFIRSYNYKPHLATHGEKREYPLPCTVDGCTKKFVRKTDLQ
ncbi:related to epithelial zinc-finger ezf protein [Fusarium fujikuroi]|nr:related to epithelial zinc-finger ezf protein [Fusarium fujikuroi]